MWDEIHYQKKLFLDSVENEDMDGIKKATHRGVNLPTENQKAMDVAIEKDNFKMVQYFIKQDFEIKPDYIEAAKSDEIKAELTKALQSQEKKKAKELENHNHASKKVRP